MTRKHFAAIADALKQSRPAAGPHQRRQWLADCHTICATLKQFNPDFNRSRFLEACGVDEDN